MPNQNHFDVVDLLPALDSKLIDLLKSLSPKDWDKQTIAKQWKVKDVVAHLLDGNIRALSIIRDDYRGENPDIKSYQDLVDFLNKLNADWVKAFKRVSPQMLIAMHELTGPLYCAYYKSLDPNEKSVFSVAWAGETESKNWMHIAREYSEKFLHQQQIREAVDKPGLMTREFYHPFMDIFMYALPYTYRNTPAKVGATVKVTITSEIGGSWYVVSHNGTWRLEKEIAGNPSSEVIIDPETAWKLFSKSWRPEQVKEKIRITGDAQLGEVALSMVSVMA